MQRATSITLSERLAEFRDLLFGKLLIIFQLPKTGSQTIEASLQNCGLPHRIIRCHYLSAARESELRQSVISHPAPAEWTQLARKQIDEMPKLRRIIRLRRLLSRAGVEFPKLEVISAVRDPIGVALSSIFQNHAYFVPTPKLLTPQRCRELLLRPGMTLSVQEWFDVEIKPLLGIDVYEQPFPRTKGYAVYETRAVRMLLYRIELLDQLPAVLRQFLGCKLSQVFNRNLGRSKSYGEIYADVKAHLSLPTDFVHACYMQKFARHFYAPAELSHFFHLWTRGERFEVNHQHKPVHEPQSIVSEQKFGPRAD